MAQLQYLMHAERKHSLLVVLQGLDAAGKDGVVRHIFTGIDPPGASYRIFKQPTPESWPTIFFGACIRMCRQKGSVAIFNRSHYEDVLVVTRARTGAGKGLVDAL